MKAFKDIQKVMHDFQILRDGLDEEFQTIYNHAERLGRSVGLEPFLPRLPNCKCTGKLIMLCLHNACINFKSPLLHNNDKKISARNSLCYAVFISYEHCIYYFQQS